MEKKRIGAINKDLVDKTEIYKELTGISTVKLVEDLLTEFFKDKLITNDFIELEEPLYFFRNGTLVKLFHKRELNKKILNKPTSDKPDSNFKFHTYVIKKVPNNLDVFNKEYGKYCYNNNPNLHKGIYLYKDISLGYNAFKFISSFLLFEYNELTNKITIEELDLKEIPFQIDITNEEFEKIYKSLEEEYLAINEMFHNDLSDDFILNEYIPSREVIDNLAVKECSERFDIIKTDIINSDNVDSYAHRNKCITAEDIEVYFQL